MWATRGATDDGKTPVTHPGKQIVNLHVPSPRPVVALIAGVTLATVVLAGCSTTASPPTPSSGTAAPTESTFDADTVKQLDSILESAVTTGGMPGAVVAIWSPEGDYVSAAGYADKADKTAMTTDLNHRIGSVTKTFTVTALLRLVDTGTVSLDDPISDYVDGVRDGDRITLRHLAGMTAGIADYSQDEEWVGTLLADPRTPLSPQSLYDVVKDEPLHFEPGTTFEYSNTNTVLIGLAIEKATGKSLAEVLQAEIAAPLGLTHTFLPVAEEFPSPHAEGYTRQTLDGSEAVATDWNPSWGWAAGAIISNLDDLKVWVPALATGELLSPELQKERLDVTPFSPEDPDSGYGLGLFTLDGWIGHNGSLPGYKTVTVHLPEKEMTVVAFVNSDVDDESDLAGRLLTPITELLTPENVYAMG